ncbi:type III restriction-modification system endonuclease [Corynebacterium parakroppenstedtii]|uniref:type III restriction-modification system endonuclease n=1 Tax=Corynebacterium parakroppenstedtii TaxID=2828363 RepID=UPI001C8F79F6|nr:type III restriction-modification system endonuclease [Corynebacterium parakroppenstedtii]MBY0795233.1 type III restriction-modification system endonuclease [Corynebacterium parakroppenstedtii]
MDATTTLNFQLVELEHQSQAVDATMRVFEGVDPEEITVGKSNPDIASERNQLLRNVESIQKDPKRPIPLFNRGCVDADYFGIDIHMETGTGKTYVYAKTMLEMHKQLGVNKFIVAVPSLAIKQGAVNFLTADYVRDHFASQYNEVEFSVYPVESRTSRTRPLFPLSVTNFVNADASDPSEIHVLVVNSGMLKTGKNDSLNRSDYDQTLIGQYNQPYEALAAIKPVVIIDEPHRFKRNNVAFGVIEKRIKPQVIIRYGATFPDYPYDRSKKSDTTRVDYNNLVFSLGALESFNRQLVKGVDVHSPSSFDENSRRFKLVKIAAAVRKGGKPKLAHFIELGGRDGSKEIARWELAANDSLTALAPEFAGLTIDFPRKEAGEKDRIVLSSGQEIYPGGVLINALYSDEYQEAMLRQAVKQHFDKERELFFRGTKIKALTLLFIDSIASYERQNNEGRIVNGRLAVQFEQLLTKELQEEIKKYIDRVDERSREYVDYLQATLNDVHAAHGGYFSGDLDSKKNDKQLEDKLNQILKDKQRLISFKNENGGWNTMRFIFSKWALREGWDNPNVFQIAKLRSSGSEISKLQEVGRGLRLPVDENGVRNSEDEFHLTYFVDYSERDFAQKLISDINGDYEVTNVHDDDLLKAVADSRDIEPRKLFIALLNAEFIDYDGTVNEDTRDKFLNEYPEFGSCLRDGVIRDYTRDGNRKKKLGNTNIRKDNYAKLRYLWESINKRYIIDFEEVDVPTLDQAMDYALKRTDDSQFELKLRSERTVRSDKNQGKLTLMSRQVAAEKLDKEIPYGKFIKDIAEYTQLPVDVIHRAIVRKNNQAELPDKFFTSKRYSQIKMGFDEWFLTNYMGKYSYKRVEAPVKGTALTDASGEPFENIAVGRIGVERDDDTELSEKFLYDQFLYDSELEHDNIDDSNRRDVDQKLVVFGKIPRRSIKIPHFYGGTTSPDFMYVLEDGNNNTSLNFIIETKSRNGTFSTTEEENSAAESARKFFEAVRDSDEIDAEFFYQMKTEALIDLINTHLANHGHDKI